MRIVLSLLVFVLLFTGVIGCGAAHENNSYTSSSAPAKAYSPPTARMGSGAVQFSRDSDSEKEAAEKDDPSQRSSIGNRKIIYTADTSIVVEDFSLVEPKLRQLVQQHRGFIAQADLDTRNQKSRSGRWTVRVPVDQFDGFLAGTETIGVITNRSRDAQDVTEEYVDIESRIRNKQKLEARILQLLERPDDKIQHVIEVEKELGRVREAIETMQGRIRHLKDQTELTTVRLSVTEEKAYQPPLATGFTDRISSAWNGSLTSSKRGLENFAVWLAGHILPLAFWGIIAIAVWMILGSKIKKRLSQLSTQSPTNP